METLLVENFKNYTTITLHRPQQKNSLNLQLLQEFNQALDLIENISESHAIVIQGYVGCFSTGMDLQEIATLFHSAEKIGNWTSLYMSTLNRMTTFPKIIIALINGKTLAGGIGLVAASDYVIATQNAEFKLTELCWGLLPAMVAPFLIRRIGFQKAYTLSLTHRTLNATEAHQIALIDELTDNLESSLHLFLERIMAIDSKTKKEFKSYFHKNWGISEEIKNQAIEKTTELLQSPEVQARINAFIQHQTLPWKK